jgi:hypothetical protein
MFVQLIVPDETEVVTPTSVTVNVRLAGTLMIACSLTAAVSVVELRVLGNVSAEAVMQLPANNAAPDSTA